MPNIPVIYLKNDAQFKRVFGGEGMNVDMLRTVAIVGAAIGMMLIAGTQMGSVITAIMWIGAFLILFLLPRTNDSED